MCVCVTVLSSTQGMLSARGERLLMVDADGATLFKDIERLEKEMDSEAPNWVRMYCVVWWYSVWCGGIVCGVVWWYSVWCGVV